MEVAACCCHPKRGWDGSSSRNSPGERPSAKSSLRWALATSSLQHCRALHDGSDRHGLFWSPQCVKDDIHHCRVAIVDHLERISPTGPLCCWRCPRALRRPMPPSHEGRDDCSWAPQFGWTLNIRQRHCHIPSSCAWANSCVSWGLTALRKKFDRAAAQNDSKSHADRVSWTAGIRSNNTLCSEFLFWRNFFTNSGWPNGTPSTLNPRLCGGRELSPRQTTASGKLLAAMRCNIAHPGGGFRFCSTPCSFQHGGRCPSGPTTSGGAIRALHPPFQLQMMYKSSKYANNLSPSCNVAATAASAGC